MRRLSITTRKAMEKQDDLWVTTAEELVSGIKGDKERQLRNIQSLCEMTSSWKAVELFIRYQAARKYLDSEWAETAVEQLASLKKNVPELCGKDDDPDLVHLELVGRVLGYAVRHHVWNIKGRNQQR